MRIIRKNVWRNYPENTSKVVKWSFWNDCFTIETWIICFNTRSGAIILLNNEEFLIYNGQPWLAPGILVKLGIVVPREIDEKQEWCNEYNLAKEDSTFLDLTILTTLQCQFQCIYCFEGEKSNNIITEDTCASIKSFLEKRKGRLNKLHVTWFGGEPLLGLGYIRKLSAFIIDFCKKHNIYYYADITTNGYALSQSKCDILVNECNIKRYIITMDGTADVHNKRRPLRNGAGTYDVIWANISTLVNIGAMVTIRVTIDRNNSEGVKAFINQIASSPIAKKTGLVFVRTIDYSFTPDIIKNTIYTNEEFAELELEFIQYAHLKGVLEYTTPSPCPLGGCLRKGDIVIGTKGEIYKCLDTIGEEQWIAGHISDDNKINKASWYQSWLSWEPSNAPGCVECKLQPMCNGGCPHNALFISKKHGTDSQCPDWRYNYKKIIELYINEKMHKHEYKEI